MWLYGMIAYNTYYPTFSPSTYLALHGRALHHDSPRPCRKHGGVFNPAHINTAAPQTLQISIPDDGCSTTQMIEVATVAMPLTVVNVRIFFCVVESEYLLYFNVLI